LNGLQLDFSGADRVEAYRVDTSVSLAPTPK
jgi:hypothetical protein